MLESRYFLLYSNMTISLARISRCQNEKLHEHCEEVTEEKDTCTCFPRKLMEHLYWRSMYETSYLNQHPCTVLNESDNCTNRRTFSKIFMLESDKPLFYCFSWSLSFININIWKLVCWSIGPMALVQRSHPKGTFGTL